MVKCSVCTNHLKDNTDSLVLCNFHKAPVHLGCCTDVCSMHGAPCEHSLGVYKKE